MVYLKCENNFARRLIVLEQNEFDGFKIQDVTLCERKTTTILNPMFIDVDVDAVDRPSVVHPLLQPFPITHECVARSSL